MNFFQAQDRARRNTLLLVLLFCGGVAATVLVLYVVAFYALALSGYSTGGWQQVLANAGGTSGARLGWEEFRWDRQLLLDTTIGVLAFLSLGSLYKTLELSMGGGKRVAEAMGGRLLLHSTTDAQERRLLNIVEEMAVAAGAPMPDVYLMNDSQINAFAAGTTPHNAVIGVTSGTLQHLTRAQVQGVVAHEFSHIMNGDMRLNIRLIAIIHGIMLLGYLGYAMLRGAAVMSYGRSRDGAKAAAGLMAAGAALALVGFVGSFFGGLIRAAVSRQREFLADAAAVQYTRNPQGIAGALDAIWRSHALISQHPRALEFSHLFFSMAVRGGLSNPFATHPPLQERIQRILPEWRDNAPIYIRQEGDKHMAQVTEKGAAPAPVGRGGGAAIAGLAAGAAAAVAAGAAPPPPRAEEVLEQIGTVSPAALESAHNLLASLPPPLLHATQEPYGARALIYALLLDEQQPAVRAKQLQHLDAHADTGVAALTSGLWPHLSGLPPRARLPLVQAALPALHLLSPAQHELFKSNMAALIAADDSMNLFEWCLQAVAVHHLQEYFGERRRTYGDKAASMEYALSILAQCARAGRAADAFAIAVRQAQLPLAYIKSQFQPRRLFYALQHIAALSPRKKQQFALAAVHIATHDGRIGAEAEGLLRAYFMIAGCPLPLLASAHE